MFTCDTCGKPIGDEENPIFQVRIGYSDENIDEEEVFVPEEDMGYYCSVCLQKGV